MSSSSPNPKVIHVMCADDNNDFADLFMTAVARAPGIRCERCFPDAGSLLDFLGGHPINSPELPHVVVLDWSMPGISTGTTIHMLRVGWPHIKVAVFTALPRSEVEAKAIEAGAAAVLSKTEGMPALLATIRRLFEADSTD